MYNIFDLFYFIAGRNKIFNYATGWFRYILVILKNLVHLKVSRINTQVLNYIVDSLPHIKLSIWTSLFLVSSVNQDKGYG